MDEEKTLGPQIQRREKWVELPAEYAGFKAKVWINGPTALWSDMNSGEEGKALEAAKKLVLAHNGWRDFDGKEYPPPAEDTFWELIPTELAACVLAAIQAEVQKLPNSMLPQKRRSRRG